MSSPYYHQTDDLFLAALTAVAGLGPRRLTRLKTLAGSWQEVFRAQPHLFQEAKIPIASIAAWQTAQKVFNPEKLASSLEQSHTYIICRESPGYFAGLKDLDDAPLLLYARGHWPAGESIITVIGSRHPSPAGKKVAFRLVPTLARAGVSLASGLALGIDTAVHRLTLAAEGHTIAMLGSGLDCIYPWENAQLAQQILAGGGLLLSEYPPSSSPLKAHFILRDRLLAAVGQKLLVIEAGEKSGSMTTARIAQQLNRPIFTVSGDEASGSQQLAKEGAKETLEPLGILSD